MHKIRMTLTKMYMKALLSTPEGRAHVLNQIADAEDNGEARLFDDAIALVDDPKLQRMIKRHREDEVRHGQLFRACVEKTGVEPGPVPERMQVLFHINEAMGGFLQKPMKGTEDVMTAYLILQALEERAMEQFEISGALFEQYDAETAEVFRSVAKDEARHLRYCVAISRRYAPDEPTRLRALQRMRKLEAESFRKSGKANMDYVRSRRMITKPRDRWMVSVFQALSERSSALPYTGYGLPGYGQKISLA